MPRGRKRIGSSHAKPRTTIGYRPATRQENGLERLMHGALVAAGLTIIPQADMGVCQPDFLVPSARVVIECDGTFWHSRPAQIRRDRQKDRFYAGKGYLVIRLPERAIRANAALCAMQVAQVCTRRTAGHEPKE